jgi:hypothetical protein
MHHGGTHMRVDLQLPQASDAPPGLTERVEQGDVDVVVWIITYIELNYLELGGEGLERDLQELHDVLEIVHQGDAQTAGAGRSRHEVGKR